MRCKRCPNALTGRQRVFCSLRCKRQDSVTTHRRRIKMKAIEALGGRCSRCGYDRCVAALTFHHTRDKHFGIGDGMSRSWKRTQEELKKCVLLCLNCHAEEHATRA